MDFTEIKKICRTASEQEANQKLDDGWVLINILNSGFNIEYLLVRS
ncbi:hypothetical protein FB479_11627 [Brevibacillus sp. AG162]|nr:hypothetical protein [Brevibacillus sp. AG162]TQK41926.1 hypothetical protein FB479_11627 [Brevibacillus sp. AG162]